MNNQLIHVKHNDIISKMPPQVSKFIRAQFEGKKFIDMTEHEALTFLKEKIVVCIRSIGHYTEANDTGVIAFLCKGAYLEIIKNRKKLTDIEMGMILENLAKGIYKRKKDEFIACNLLSINLSIDAFYEDEVRRMAIIDYTNRINEPEPKKEPTPDEIEKIMQRGCNEAYEAFLKDGSIPYAARSIYDYLKKANGIKWTEPERLQIEHEAKVANDHKTRELKSVTVAQLAERLLGEKKRVALTKYFHKCKAGGINQILSTK